MIGSVIVNDLRHPYRTMDDREWQGRIKNGHHERATKHLWCNPHPPYGYDIVNGRLVPNSAEWRIVREMFFMRGVGLLSFQKIATELNTKGWRTKRNKLFNARAVRDIIRNLIYVGEFRVAGVLEHIEEVRLVSDREFQMAQRAMKYFSRYRHRGARSSEVVKIIRET